MGWYVMICNTVEVWCILHYIQVHHITLHYPTSLFARRSMLTWYAITLCNGNFWNELNWRGWNAEEWMEWDGLIWDCPRHSWSLISFPFTTQNYIAWFHINITMHSNCNTFECNEMRYSVIQQKCATLFSTSQSFTPHHTTLHCITLHHTTSQYKTLQ